MSYLDLLAKDLDAYDAGAVRDGPRKERDTRLTGETMGSLYAVLDEIEQSAVFVAVAASIASALADVDLMPVVATDLDTYGPAEPTVYPALVTSLVQSGLDHGVILPVQAYYLRLAFAQRLSRAVIAAGPAPSADVRAEELEKLHSAWQHTCGTSLAAASALRSALLEAGVHVGPPANVNASALLHEAHVGGRPCVSETGQISVPGWAESRRAQRFPVRASARVFTSGREQTVMIDNISETGIGLSNMRGGEKGATITIELPGADLVSGRIMWNNHGRAGVKLDERLHAQHPLIERSSQ